MIVSTFNNFSFFLHWLSFKKTYFLKLLFSTSMNQKQQILSISEDWEPFTAGVGGRCPMPKDVKLCTQYVLGYSREETEGFADTLSLLLYIAHPIWNCFQCHWLKCNNCPKKFILKKPNYIKTCKIVESCPIFEILFSPER